MDKTKLFGAPAIAEREVTLADGSVEKMPFKKVGAAEWMRYQSGIGSKDPEVMSAAMLRLVFFSLCEPDGKQALTWDQVNELDQDVMTSMWRAAQKHNVETAPKKT
jgi:hypothetical protein